MKLLLISLALVFGSFITNFVNAQFPHPDRAKGHFYQKEFFSAETNYSDSSVGIFVPKGFRAGETTDFIVHFHGWRNHIEKLLTNYNLIQQFSESSRNAIFLVPQGPRDAADSFGGKLEDTNGFARFMAEAVQNLNARGIIHTTNIGNIVISGHSGGYHVMGGIVARGGMQEHVREVWLFDALYGQTPDFVAWFANPNAHRLIDIYTLHGGTKEETEKLIESYKKVPAKVPFIAKKEVDFTTDELQTNQLRLKRRSSLSKKVKAGRDFHRLPA